MGLEDNKEVNGSHSDDTNSTGRDFAQYDLHHDTHDPRSAMRRLHTAGSLTITPELFEKIYLSPKNRVSNNLRSTLGNPAPLALCGFLVSLTPLSNVLLGWRGSGGLGAAQVGVFYFFGGLLMLLGSTLEFILGNTFPCVVFGAFGAFWLSFGATLTPYFNASIAYDPTHPELSAESPGFLNTFAFVLLYMGLLCVFFLICSLRTNICLMMMFLLLIPAFGTLAAAFWKLGEGLEHAETAQKLQHAGGGLIFAVCFFGWYLFLAQLLTAVDFPFNLPVGDLSHIIKGASDIQSSSTTTDE